MIDRPMGAGEEESKKWALVIIKPFLMSLFNDQRVDFSQLVLEQAKHSLGKFGSLL